MFRMKQSSNTLAKDSVELQSDLNSNGILSPLGGSSRNVMSQINTQRSHRATQQAFQTNSMTSPMNASMHASMHVRKAG
jgi:hypothetical protein